jgi:hypothetical protein
LQYLAVLVCSCNVGSLVEFVQALLNLRTLLLGTPHSYPPSQELQYREEAVMKLVSAGRSLRRLQYGVRSDSNALDNEHRQRLADRAMVPAAVDRQAVELVIASQVTGKHLLEELTVQSLSLAALEEVLQACPRLHTLYLSTVSTVEKADLPTYFRPLAAVP